MSKRITTRWYIVAWVVWVVAAILEGIIVSRSHGGSLPLAGYVLYLVLTATGVTMLVLWVGALVNLWSQHATGWFGGVLIAHLIGLGIVGMIAYAVAGPEDKDEIVTRPTTT